MTLLAATVLTAASCDAPPPPPLPGAMALPLRGTRPVGPIPKVDFTLVDTEGAPYDFQERTEGRVSLLFFGYTFCPDICPIHMATLASALSRLDPEAREQVEVVFVSVDPERDTPERIREWLDAFDTTFVGVTGSPAQIEEALAFYRYPPPERSAEDTRIYTVGHPALIYAFGADGLGYAMYGPETTPAVWEHDLALLSGYPWEDAPAPVEPPGVPDGTVMGQVGQVRVIDAWIPKPAPGQTAALYLTLRNIGPVADTLVSIATARAREASVHVTRVEEGVARMESLGVLPLPPSQRVEMAPGGIHVMLMGVDPDALAPGRPEGVTLTFARAGRLTVPARVVDYRDAGG